MLAAIIAPVQKFKNKYFTDMSHQQQILDNFLQNKQLLEGFRDKINSLLKDLLYLDKIQPHQITCRVKGKESLAGKIERKKDKYTDLKQITDLVGIRIITYFDDDVDKIASIIEKEFKIDKENSIDKRILEADKFGYRSLHYIVSLTEDRLKFTDTKIYTGLKAEIQIRSILQHAWAEIEHDIGYKGEIEIPRFAKRGFYRIAALLETADIEFVKLKESLKKYESEIKKNIENKPDEVLIDKASLSNYIHESTLLKEIEEKMQRLLPIIVMKDDLLPNYNFYLQLLEYFKINTIKELNSELNNFKNQIPHFFKEFAGDSKQVVTPKGLPIFYLGYILAAKSNDIEMMLAYITKMTLPISKETAQNLLNIFNGTLNSR